MRIIILKETQKPLASNRTFKVGQNITVTPAFGKELIKKKAAGQIPQLIGDVWYFDGRPSDQLATLRKPKPVTVEEYLENTKEIKKVKEK